MRTVLTSSVRPRIGQPQAVLSHGSSIPLRRTAIPSLRRKLTLCDAFTILLAPVLTAAFVADITRKDKRRHDWDQKIAQIQQEIDELRERELRSWNTLQIRSIQAGIAGQRRSYSTAAASVQVKQAIADAENQAQVQSADEPSQEKPQDIPSERVLDLQRFENFLATKVGFQLLLYISTGRSPTVKLTMDGLSEGVVIPDSMDALLRHLARINKGLHDLRPKVLSGTADLSANTIERQQLDAKILQLTWQCRTGEIAIPELIYRYTQAVLQSPTGPSLDTYQSLVETFSTLDADALTSISMFPYLRTRQVLSDRNVGNIILQYGKVRDPGRLDRFLRRLTESEKSFRVATEWEVVVVNGVQIPAPINRSPRLLDILIRSALQGDRPHRARAWTTLLIQQGISARRFAALFNNFLTYCARHMDWMYGQLWLQRAITWAAFFARESPFLLQKIIFRMLDLCVSCDQPQQYELILDAAVVAGIDVPPVDETRPDAFSDKARDIRNDWSSRIKEKQPNLQRLQKSGEGANLFQTEMAKVNSAIQNFIGVTDIKRLRALMTDREEHHAKQDLRKHSISSSLKNFRPWVETYHLTTPDELLSSVAVEPDLSTVQKRNRSENLNLPDEVLGITTVATDEASRSQSDVEKHLRSLRQSYDMAKERYQARRETNHKLPKAIDKTITSEHRDHGGLEIDEVVQKLSGAEERSRYFQDYNAYLEQEINDVKSQNADLLSRLETSKETELELVERTNHLQLQLNTIKPKSLEAVFVEKENLNIRNELKALSARYLAALNDKESMQKAGFMWQAKYEQLEEKRAAETSLLRQHNEGLREQVQAAGVQYEKLTQASKAREGNLQKIVTIKEDKVKTLQAALLKYESGDRSCSSPVEAQGGSRSDEQDQEQPIIRSPRRRFSLRYHKSGMNDSVSPDNVVSPLSFSSSSG